MLRVKDEVTYRHDIVGLRGGNAAGTEAWAIVCEIACVLAMIRGKGKKEAGAIGGCQSTWEDGVARSDGEGPGFWMGELEEEYIYLLRLDRPAARPMMRARRSKRARARRIKKIRRERPQYVR